MIFTPTPISGSFVVDLEKIEDERGFFARAFCTEEFNSHGVEVEVDQANISFSEHKGTIRGLHYQKTPALEIKFIRCIRGKIQDVIVDMRPQSDTYLSHFSIDLSSTNRKALVVPSMVAHGFQTLEDHTEVIYLVSGKFSAQHEAGLNAIDPAINVKWREKITNRSYKDEQWPFI